MKNLFILVATLVLCSLLGELGLRLVVDEVNFLKPELMDHPELRHAIVPGSGGHDEWGFRNRHVPDEVEVVAIGDSQTYGTSVPSDQSWPTLIGQLTKLTVYNMAVGGYGPPDYQYLLNNKAKLLKPCLVFVGFYFGNDLPRSYQHATKSKSSSIPHEDYRSGKFLSDLRTWLSRNSLTYQMAKASGGEFIEFLRFHEPRQRTDEKIYRVATENWQTILEPGARFEAVDQSRESNRIGLSASLEIFDQIQDDCKKMNSRCVFVLIPTKLSVYWPAVGETLSDAGQRDVRAVIDEEAKVRRVVTGHLSMRKSEFVDPVEALQAAAQEDALYPSHAGGHMNARGNEVLAAEILDQVEMPRACPNRGDDK